MITIALLVITLICQVVVVSMLCPQKIVGTAQSALAVQSIERGSHQVLYRRYVLINYVIAALGLPILLLCVTLHVNDTLTMTGLLLSIAIFFLVQVSTVTIPFFHGALPVQQTPKRYPDIQDFPGGVPGLFGILPLVPVMIAAGLYLAYIFTLCVQWGHYGENQLPKIVSVTLTNLIFVSTILWAYRRLLNDTGDRVERYSELVRMGPIIIFGSILVTLYYFAKEILFFFDLHELRPMMMSVALQAIAMVAFHVLCGVKSNRTMA